MSEVDITESFPVNSTTTAKASGLRRPTQLRAPSSIKTLIAQPAAEAVDTENLFRDANSALPTQNKPTAAPAKPKGLGAAGKKAPAAAAPPPASTAQKRKREMEANTRSVRPKTAAKAAPAAKPAARGGRATSSIPPATKAGAAKSAQYDVDSLKDRLASMEAMVSSLKGELYTSTAQVTSVVSQVASSQQRVAELEGLRTVIEATRMDVDMLRAQDENTAPAVAPENNASQAELDAARMELRLLKETSRREKEEDIRNATERLEQQLKTLQVQSEAASSMARSQYEQELSMAASRHAQELSGLARDHATLVATERARFEAQTASITAQAELATAQLRAELARTTQTFESRLAALSAQSEAEIGALTTARNGLQREVASLSGDLHVSREECVALKTTIAQQSSELVNTAGQVRVLTVKTDNLTTEVANKNAEIASLQGQLAEAMAYIARLEEKSRSDEMLRRSLHETIQELKGNIRVFCRVRPLLGAEREKYGDQYPYAFPENCDSRKLEVQVGGKTKVNGEAAASKKYEFQFDRVFAPTTSQGEVFGELAQLVQSALDGYNVCIFAYGQTGSGKTHTMEGSHSEDGSQAGMIPRAVAQVFDTATALRERGWEYSFEGSYLEIYNETIRDLLDNARTNPKHEIKHDLRALTTTVTDLMYVPVNQPDDVFALLGQAAGNRSVARTHMNEQSSRSHSVFTLKLTGRNTVTGVTCTGSLNLIDLAGSERLDKSGSTGERLKETQAINKSLSALADVIVALGNKAGHVPYRNSKLTYLLQHSLGGNSKMLMFANVSPLESNLQETLCSLRFATKVNSVDIGTAKQSVAAAMETD